MELVSHAAIPAAFVTWSRTGAPSTTLVCKLTFELAQGTARLASKHLPLWERDEHDDDDPAASIFAPNDLAPFKPRADVVLVGNAYAPEGEPVRSLVTRLAVAGIDKAIEVHCDRVLTPNGKVLDGPWFDEMPLGYERAAGGPGTENPIGVPPDATADDHFGTRLPNLELFGSKANGVAGFGPLAPTWPERLVKAGRQAKTLIDGSWTTRALPKDLDPAFFNVAPLDQRVDRLAEGLRITLEHLHPRHPRIVTMLPRMRPRVFTEVGSTVDEFAVTADTLWIDTVRGVATLTFRGAVAPRPGAVRAHVLLEDSAKPLSQAEVHRLCEVGRPPSVAPSGRRGTLPNTPAPGRGARNGRVEETTCAEDSNAGDASPAWLKQSAQDDDDVEPPSGPTQSLPAVQLPPAALPMSLGIPLPPQSQPPQPAPSQPSAPAVVPPPPVSPPATVWSTPAHVAAEGYAAEGVLAVSNAAAGAHPQVAEPTTAPLEDETPAPASAKRAAPILDLLWFDAEVMTRVRDTKRWVERISSCRPPVFETDGTVPAEPPAGSFDRGDLLAVLSGGAPTPVSGLAAAVAQAAASRRGFSPPLVVVVGELTPSFDEIATLEATLSATSPFVGADKKLKEASDVAKELLASPWLEGATDVVEGLTARVREAFHQGAKGMPQNFLDVRVERTLLKQRCYAKVTVLGATWTRAELADGGSSPVPVYLATAASERLPIFRRFPVRLIAEVHLSQDQFESHAYALKAVALAREAPSGR